MDPTENLRTLHRHEEEVRTTALAAISARADLADHWLLVSEAMNVIFAFAHDHMHESDDELTLQLLGVRLFNAAGASIKLALAGYYQKAFGQVRDVLETYFLIDYLKTHPQRISQWKAANNKVRIALFGPGIVRNALDTRDGFKAGARKKIYEMLSEYASHASYSGFALLANANNLGQVGPFFDDQKLVAWLEELVKRLGHAGLILTAGYKGADGALLATVAHYQDVLSKWSGKYFVSQTTRAGRP